MTICTKCIWFLPKEPNSPRADCEYNHLCMAKKLPVAMRPYDGKCMPYTFNSFGERYFTDDKYVRCDTLNDGNCKLFDPSSRLAAVGSRGAQ